MSIVMNEGLCKQFLAAFYRRVRKEGQAVVLRALLNEVYAAGVTAGKMQTEQRGAHDDRR